jgi:protein ImuB
METSRLRTAAAGASRNSRRRSEQAAADPAILLVQTIAGTQRIAGRCAPADKSGVQIGMTLAHARALLVEREVHVEAFDPQRDRRALDALANWALRFSPIVAVDPPDGLLLDITGCQRVFHGERRLLNAVVNAMHWLGLSARAAIADTFGCAWAAAHFSGDERLIVAAGDERAALAPLPIEALRLEEDTVDALREVNLEQVGHLLALPRLELAARFGSNLLLRLDQATGETIETIEPIRPREIPLVERAFAGPVRQPEAIAMTVRELLDELTMKLRRQENGAQRLDLHFERIDAHNLDETIELSRPSRDEKHLWSLLQPRIERLHLGYGIERITIAAPKTGRLRHEQAARWNMNGRGDDTTIDKAFGELVDTVSGRFGAQRTLRIEAMQSHIPERAFRLEPAMHRPRRRSREETMTVTVAERPSLLFERPEPIEVMALTPDGVPSWMRWRGVARSIISGGGPERLAEPWWDIARDEPALASHDRDAADELPAAPPLRARDYFRVQDETGRWLWVYRRLDTGRWFVHGEWA